MTLLCWLLLLLVHLSKWLWAQTQLQWWTQLVQASGGALNPQKYCCALYYWRPDTSGILHLTTIDPENINIALCNIRLQQTIHVLKLDEGTQYLGLYIHNLEIQNPCKIMLAQSSTLHQSFSMDPYVPLWSKHPVLLLLPPSTYLLVPSHGTPSPIPQVPPQTINIDNFEQDGIPP